jgi:hypothetical protein
VICESQIAVHDLSKPILIAFSVTSHDLNDSLILSKIRIFASIASPIESIAPAMDASVSTAPDNLTSAIKKSV